MHDELTIAMYMNVSCKPRYCQPAMSQSEIFAWQFCVNTNVLLDALYLYVPSSVVASARSNAVLVVGVCGPHHGRVHLIIGQVGVC